ncbi:open rectifier K[+] channel 1 isoform X2 [Calliopsis andreniformis]|uniref:open rectifier K[+] channel 1 isoform X2 n=1 Tax=Calliopsis andreniformis TaxID=337506 RepID=UPI003FCE19A1
MSKKQWIVLLMLFLTYLLLGASIFYHIESRLEIERVEKAKRERIEINALLHAHYMPSNNHDHDEILGKLTRYCGKSVYNYTEGETDPLKWDFYNSFYFAYTVVSTIGYGNLAPTNMLGRILMIFYGLVGIPINGILLAQLGEFFGRVFVKAHQKYKSYKLGRADYHPRKLTTFETRKVGLAAQIFAYLTPGFVMFIFFPAFLFSHYEGWNYDEAVYYAFVTLTTIGFGDYVAGQDNSKGMRSKKITRIEHKLALNLKHTQSKIWNEFNKEINYLRRVFNELQLSKVKRVYVDECNHEIPPAKLPRSNSFPDLRGLSYGAKGKEDEEDDDDDDDDGNGIMRPHLRPRRRANSEVVPTADQIARVVSETDLQRIDKTATFATHAMVQPAELLARLVNILGYIPPVTEDVADDDYSTQTTSVEQQDDRRSKFEGINHGKNEHPSEKESIYARQNSGSSTWATTANEYRALRFPPRPRSRAASEIRLNESKNREERNQEWTWSGPITSKKIQELMRARTNETSSKDRGGGGAAGGGGVKDTAKFSKLRKALTSTGPWKHRFSVPSEKKDAEFQQREQVNGNDSERTFASTDFTTHPNDEDSNNSRRHYHTHTGGNDFVTESRNLLEETSLADFLTALTLLHATVTNTTSNKWIGDAAAAGDDSHVYRTRPRRKMGTASLTPPKLPSLFTLFSSASHPSGQPTTRTNNDAIGVQNSNGESIKNSSSKSPLTQISQSSRRNSLAFVVPTVTKPRRFSLRPVATPVSPPTPPKTSCSPFLSDAQREQYATKSTFSFESSKEPLIRTEGELGFSSPIKPPSINDRRSSLRSIQYHSGISTSVAGGGGGGAGGGGGSERTSVTAAPMFKAVPRWKAGMLQRQISQMNLRRRVRAFSLSDVHAENINPKETFDRPSATYEKDSNRRNISSFETSTRSREEPAKLIENSPRFTSPITHSSDRRTSFPREIISSNIRLKNESVPPIANNTLFVSNEMKIRSPYHPSNNGNEEIRPESATSAFQNFRDNAKKQSFPDIDLSITNNRNQRDTSLITVDADSQESLMEVKIENPATRSLQVGPCWQTTIDISQHDPVSLMQSKVQKQQTDFRPKKS